MYFAGADMKVYPLQDFFVANLGMEVYNVQHTTFVFDTVLPRCRATKFR